MHRAHAAGAAASRASVLDNRSLPLALVASARHTEEALLKIHLTAASTSGTGLRRCSRFRTVAAAGLAGGMAGNFDFLFRAGNRFFEFERQVVAQVFGATAAPATSLAATEKLTEDIAEN